jgi:hypothetical protein
MSQPAPLFGTQSGFSAKLTKYDVEHFRAKARCKQPCPTQASLTPLLQGPPPPGGLQAHIHDICSCPLPNISRHNQPPLASTTRQVLPTGWTLHFQRACRIVAQLQPQPQPQRARHPPDSSRSRSRSALQRVVRARSPHCSGAAAHVRATATAHALCRAAVAAATAQARLSAA